MWIPGHMEIERNEIAYQQAKNATKNTEIIHIHMLAYDVIKFLIREKSRNKRFSTWNQRHTKLITIKTHTKHTQHKIGRAHV